MRHPSRATLFVACLVGVACQRPPARDDQRAGGLCCDRGVPAATCRQSPTTPGGFSIYYEDVEFAGAPPVDVLTKSSGLFAEAAESVTKCGAICEVRTADCGAFTFSRDARFGNASCSLFAVPPSRAENVPALLRPSRGRFHPAASPRPAPPRRRRDAAVCNYFVVVAPETVHADTDCKCDAVSYRRRAWCRAEVMSCWARNGTGDMYLSTNQTLEPLAPSNDVLAESLDVFSGELTCCSLGHPNGCLCDREHLMLPMLGMYGMVYRDRHGVARDAYAVLEPIREKLFPKTFVYSRFVEDGVRGDGDCGNEKIETTEPLFGDLVEAVERDIDLASAQSDDPILRARPPDYVPGTNAQRRAGLRRTRKLHAENSLRSLDKSLRALDKLRSSFLK